MKILGYIYGTILLALENKISVEKALDMIRAVLSEQGQEILQGHKTSNKNRKEA